MIKIRQASVTCVYRHVRRRSLRFRWLMGFQQDGAPNHYLRDTRNYLGTTFESRCIRGSGPTVWPARSLDLFFLISFCGDKCMKPQLNLLMISPPGIGES